MICFRIRLWQPVSNMFFPAIANRSWKPRRPDGTKIAHAPGKHWDLLLRCKRNTDNVLDDRLPYSTFAKLLHVLFHNFNLLLLRLFWFLTLLILSMGIYYIITRVHFMLSPFVYLFPEQSLCITRARSNLAAFFEQGYMTVTDLSPKLGGITPPQRGH